MQLRKLGLGLLAVAPTAMGVERCESQPGNDTHAELDLEPRLLQARQTYPVPPATNIYMHVIAGSTRREDGYLTEAEVLEQVKIIQDTYARPGNDTGLRFTFNRNQIQWHVNTSWVGAISYSSPAILEMKRALHVGDYRTLNIYMVHQTNLDRGGSCTNPFTWATEQPNARLRVLEDGCLVSSFSINNSGHAYMNKGLTAVHEIGHWFGLFHTFDGPRSGSWHQCSANNPNDEVDDTPRHFAPSKPDLCDLTLNTCPEPAGEPQLLDPVTNYMYYSKDSCYDQFTKGQVARMHMIWDQYRKSA